MTDEKVVSTTESVCPECLARVPAARVLAGDRLYLDKTCPEHGGFRALIWQGEPSYASWSRPKIPTHPERPSTSRDRGCPWDCGLCPDHRQQTCCTLFEVTARCDLCCSFCFADTGNGCAPDPGLETIEGWYRMLLERGGPFVVQLSGGEPTVRDDLPAIISLGRSLGFEFLQLNTNGLRLAREDSYAEKLRTAGLSWVFLQFDGMDDGVYEKLRGRPLLREKLAAVDRCAAAGLGVVLVPTLVRGVNVGEIGKIVDYAVRRIPAVRGVHFQPVSYFGRHPGAPADEDRITIPEIIREIEKQTAGRMKTGDIKPSGGQNAHCSFSGNFVLMPDGTLKAWSSPDTAASCCAPKKAGEGAARARRFVSKFWSAPVKPAPGGAKGPSLGEWDVFVERIRTHSLCLSGMAFQDAWNLDLDRLKDCCIHVVNPGGGLVPFCAYNLTDRSGRSIYRRKAF